MQWLSPYGNPYTSLSAGYIGDERKQIPLFSSKETAVGLPFSGTRGGSPTLQLNGGIQ